MRVANMMLEKKYRGRRVHCRISFLMMAII
jgi:hypothetical protein